MKWFVLILSFVFFPVISWISQSHEWCQPGGWTMGHLDIRHLQLPLRYVKPATASLQNPAWATSQGSWTYSEEGAIYHIQELTDNYTWLVSFWLTGDRHVFLLARRVLPVLLFWTPELWRLWDLNLSSPDDLLVQMLFSGGDKWTLIVWQHVRLDEASDRSVYVFLLSFKTKKKIK